MDSPADGKNLNPSSSFCHPRKAENPKIQTIQELFVVSVLMLNIWMVVVWLVGSKLPTPLIKPAGQTDSTIQSGCSFSMTSQGIVSGLGNPELQLMVTDDTTWALTPTLTRVRTPRLTRCVLICHLGVLMQSDVRHGYHGDNMIDPEQKDSTVRRRRCTQRKLLQTEARLCPGSLVSPNRGAVSSSGASPARHNTTGRPAGFHRWRIKDARSKPAVLVLGGDKEAILVKLDHLLKADG